MSAPRPSRPLTLGELIQVASHPTRRRSYSTAITAIANLIESSNQSRTNCVPYGPDQDTTIAGHLKRNL
jgi:hypothetical protein